MSNRTNGSVVRELETEFAKYVGAKYAIAMMNGTCTLHTALVALGVRPGDKVAVPPLTMASTTLAVLHAGAVPVFRDVFDDDWTMKDPRARVAIPVALYGCASHWADHGIVEDAAQTLNKHRDAAFTSYSFQSSKILSAGEGGMLVTDDPFLATQARSFASLGYPLGAVGESIVGSLKSPQATRHLTVGYNYRMSDVQAALVLEQLERADELLAARKYAADCYREAIQGCDWITPQYVPEGWPMSWWTYAFAIRESRMWEPLAEAIVAAGGERPYAAWRLTYDEPAFDHLKPHGLWHCDTCGRIEQSNKMPGSLRCQHWGGDCTGQAYPTGGCPVAEDLQPRLMQMQTNHRSRGESERAAEILKAALDQVSVTA